MAAHQGKSVKALKTEGRGQTTYPFKLIFKLPGAQQDVTDLMHRLSQALCTDALVGLGVAGHVALEFMREASSAQVAVQSALAAVQTAFPTAKLVEASPDWVGLTDAAELIGVSRQNMRKLMLSHPDHFPSPVHAGSTAIWHLTDILRFMQERALRAPAHMVEIAQETQRLNRRRGSAAAARPRRIAMHRTA